MSGDRGAAGPGRAAPVLGLVTIGQAPRTDLLPDLLPLLGGAAYVEHGALDDVAAEDLHTVAPLEGESPLTSRLRDGTSAVLGHAALEPLLADAVRRCEDDGAHVVLVLCTGHLGEIPSRVPVLYAEPLAHAGTRAVVGSGVLGVVSPMPSQVAGAVRRWTDLFGMPVHGEQANPYTEPVLAVAAAADRLVASGARWVFLDCIGYTEEMRSAAAASSGVPVLLARSTAVRLALEALDAVSAVNAATR